MMVYLEIGDNMVELDKTKVKEGFSRFRRFKKFVGKNQLDFLAAMLTIPVLLSVILLNYNNLQSLKRTSTSPTPTPSIEKIIVTPQPRNTSPMPTPNPMCKKQVGPVEIASPEEGQTITDNPVCINISYTDTDYCSVVWSYRVNGGSWSDYNSNDICLYNMPNGNIKIELRVQSTVSQDQKTVTRNFNYQGQGTIATPTPTQATSSASM
jgi:hypothetical protein